MYQVKNNGGDRMKKGYAKDWTILIFANGNNELEPDIWKSKIDAEKIGSNSNTNVVMQIGRESRELINIIRPTAQLSSDDEEWTGVRRYYIQTPSSKLISSLGKVNMSDPHTLYKFITWGIENYPAKHFMLVLSGHGYSVIAAMPDLSQDMPYMMGVPQMCRVLNMVQKYTGVKIDILALDMCYMNTIETLFEIGKKQDSSIKYVVTHIKRAPLEGLPYDSVIGSINETSKNSNIKEVIKNLIDNANLDLVAIEMNHSKLKKIKGLLNNLGYSYLTNEKYKQISPYKFLYDLDENDDCYKQVTELQKSLRELIVYSKNIRYTDRDLININTFRAPDSGDGLNLFMLIYYSLSFNKNNYWFQVLMGKSIKEDMEFNMYGTDIALEPTVIHPAMLESSIGFMNPSIDDKQVEIIFDKLLKYKSWDNNKIMDKLIKQIESLTHSKDANLSSIN
jgi:hypothetical protein